MKSTELVSTSVDDDNGVEHHLPVKRGRKPLQGPPALPARINPQVLPEHHAQQLSEIRSEFVESDEIVRFADEGKSDSVGMIKLIRKRMARAASNLEFGVNELQKYGRMLESTQVIGRQMNALRDLAHIELELTKKSDQYLDIRSDKVVKLLEMFLGLVKKTADDTLEAKAVDMFMTKLESNLEGWEDEAEARLR